jgi:hypothetical protein
MGNREDTNVSRSTCFCALLIASGATVTQPARADEAADTAAARVLGGDGVILADAGDCQKAIEKLQRAEELHHAPTTAGRLGECEIDVGRVVSGTERLQRLLREPLATDAPAPFIDALTRARRVLDRALPRIGSIRVSAKALAGTKVEITLDGERLPEALLDNDRPADPGHHTIVATAQGYFSKTREVTLGDGESASVTLELAPDPAAQAAERQAEAARQAEARQQQNAMASAPTATAATPAPSPPPRNGAGPGAVIAFVLGGAGLATGITSGLVVAHDASDLSSTCGTSKVCNPDKQSEISSAKTWATVSTIGFGVAGAGVVTGLILLLVGNHHESPNPRQATIRPVVGPAYVGCEGAL